jgi:hypothetical protein
MASGTGHRVSDQPIESGKPRPCIAGGQISDDDLFRPQRQVQIGQILIEEIGNL